MIHMRHTLVSAKEALMFKIGDLLFHPYKGAGIVTGIQSLKVVGADEPYYSISLATGETLLVPVREERSAILSPFTAPQKIIDVLSSPPAELSTDYRQRTLDVEGKLNGGDPLQVAEVLRDLSWRQHTAGLSNGDMRLIGKAHKVLSNALVSKPNLDVKAASQLLDTILQKTTMAWKSAG
jgi:CarD family transcriptional regulator